MNRMNESVFLNIFLKFNFRERGKEGEGEGEKHPCVVASHMLPTGDLAHNAGRYSDWESSWRPFSSQPTEPHQPGLKGFLLKPDSFLPVTWRFRG